MAVRGATSAWAGRSFTSSARALARRPALKKIAPDAAASFEETLTVVQLGVPALLRKTLSSTNVTESVLSVTRNVTARVKRWRDGDMRRRWCSAGLQRAEAEFTRGRGYRQLAQLIAALDAAQLDANGCAG